LVKQEHCQLAWLEFAREILPYADLGFQSARSEVCVGLKMHLLNSILTPSSSVVQTSSHDDLSGQ